MTMIDAKLRACEKCGNRFMPRSGSGGSSQRFCCTRCPLSFHKQRLRSQRMGLYARPTTTPAAPQPAPNEEAGRAEYGFIFMGQQDFEVVQDQHGNLLLRQSRDYDGDHELRICRDYFPRFLEVLDVLRELIAEAIRGDGAS